MLFIVEKLIYFILFYFGGIFDNMVFLSGIIGWYLVYLVLLFVVICICVYLFRCCFSVFYIDNVFSIFVMLVFGVFISVVFGVVFLGRRVIEL